MENLSNHVSFTQLFSFLNSNRVLIYVQFFWDNVLPVTVPWQFCDVVCAVLSVQSPQIIIVGNMIPYFIMDKFV
jgi:hypothetical protein